MSFFNKIVLVSVKSVSLFRNFTLFVEAHNTKKQLQSFLGLANWVREYVPRFAETAAPLTDFPQKRIVFKYTPATQEAFDHLKTAIS
jgi:hypothetical protein